MLKYGNGQVQRIQTWHGVVIKAEKDWRGVWRPQVAMHSQLPRFLVSTSRSKLIKMQESKAQNA